MKTKLVTVGLLLAVSAAVWAEKRTWTLTSGAKMEAELTGFPDAVSANVKRLDGKIYRVPFTFLSEDDRTYLAREQAKQWKRVSVDGLLDSKWVEYKKCQVSGEASGTVLIRLLPPVTLPPLSARRAQTSEIKSLANQLLNLTGAIWGRSQRRYVSDADVDYIRHLYDPLSPGGMPQFDEPGPARAGAAGVGGAKPAYRLQTASSSGGGAPGVYVSPEKRAQLEAAKQVYIRLNKAKEAYAETLKKTKAITTVEMKNTGLVHEGLQVWECKDPGKAQ